MILNCISWLLSHPFPQIFLWWNSFFLSAITTIISHAHDQLFCVFQTSSWVWQRCETTWEFGYFIPATDDHFQTLCVPTYTITSVAFERRVPELLTGVVMKADNLGFKSECEQHTKTCESNFSSLVYQQHIAFTPTPPFFLFFCLSPSAQKALL